MRHNLSYLLLYFISALVVLTCLSGCSRTNGSESPAKNEASSDNGPSITQSLPIDSAGHLLRLKSPGSELIYIVKRQDRTVKTYQEQYATNLSFKFYVTVRPESESEYLLIVGGFFGEDLTGGETNHLKRIAPVIEQQIWRRSYTEFGPSSELEIDHNPAGWAGMTVSKAMGRYEHGFLETHFPRGKVGTGTSWSLANDLGRESRRSFELHISADEHNRSTIIQSGGDIEYRLVNVRQQNDRAIGKITFASKGEVTLNYVDPKGGSSISEERVSESGTIWLDLKTGWPVKARIVRLVDRITEDGTITDQYTTTVEAQ